MSLNGELHSLHFVDSLDAIFRSIDGTSHSHQPFLEKSCPPLRHPQFAGKVNGVASMQQSRRSFFGPHSLDRSWIPCLKGDVKVLLNFQTTVNFDGEIGD